MSKVERYERASKLMEQANEMIEEKLPHMWKDGDVRYLDRSTFSKIKSLLEEAENLRSPGKQQSENKKIIFRGQFGEIEIRDASKIREEFKETSK